MQQQTMVRTYKSPDSFRKDAEKLARQGWSVSNTMERQPRSGCARILLIGLFAAIFKPKPEIVVTYTRPKS